MKALILARLVLAATVILAISLSSSTFAQSTSAGTLLQFDFNDEVTWPVTSKKQSEPGVLAGKFGTIDTANSKDDSGGLMLVMDSGTQAPWIYGPGGLFQRKTGTSIRNGGAKRSWVAGIHSGPLEVRNSEANIAKLTLSFSLSVSRALPIRLIVESFNEKQERTGGVETILYPAAADFYQRYSLDLSSMKPTGIGAFRAIDPFVSFTFETGSDLGWPSATHHELRLDNIHYAKAAYYVRPDGKDSDDGRTEKTAFATVQKAIDSAQPGDIVLLMNGDYKQANSKPPRTPIANLTRPGTPAAWITLKNYPLHKPTLSAHGQSAVNIVQKKDQPTLAYIEIRSLNIRGNGDTARAQYSDEIGKQSPNTDSMGIVVNARYTPWPGTRTDGEIIHNIRIADNTIEYCTADGIYVEYCDWLFVEGNKIENNCWTTSGYAPSGLSVMGYANFDLTDNSFKMLIAGNQVSGNRLTVKNHPRGRGEERTVFYNGNGILLDANAEKQPNVYRGRTLVQNNLVFNNGGGGIQMWGSHRLDLVNNTIYKNATVLPWGQVAMERCQDVRLINNIIVAPLDAPLDTWVASRADEQTSTIFRANNLYWGGVEPNVEGFNDINADPQFVNPTTDSATANFQLQATSPAAHAGRWEAFTSPVDLAGKPRPPNRPTSLGAFSAAVSPFALQK